MAGIRIINLVKKFGEVTAVDHINLDIKDGEFMTLLGPSGCGKTTTLRMIAGLEVPTDGEIYIGDKLVSSPSKGIFIPPEQRNIGMVFQNYAVWPHMTVFDNVAYPLKIRKLPKDEIEKKVMRVLEMVRLKGFENRYPHQLSGGQQQRVALARALVMEPEVMLLDEPLSNLDAKLREEMRFEIKDLQRKIGITIVYVTHDQAEAMAMSDRIAVMEKGRIHQIGSPWEIYKRPADAFVAGFIGLANFLKFDKAKIEENHAEVTLFGGKVKITCAPPLKKKGELILVVRPSEIDILKNPEPNTVEGIVKRATFLGDIVDYLVQVEGQEIRVQSKPTEIFNTGSKVYLKINHATLVNL
ncbi:ABC transporter ATP-binding protein [Thermococcus barophilus]|uniref:ABC transporter ATP-binding protein n=1 Tax=Thermococcus barophilus TaxID=55802 RepID=UPI0007048635